MSKKIIALTFVFLAMASLTSGGFSAPDRLTKCRILSKPLYLKTTRIYGTVSSGSTLEYHLKTTSDLYPDIRLTNSRLKLDIYLTDPPTVIKKGVAEWSGQFFGEKEYVLALNNCSGKTSAKFQLEIKGLVLKKAASL